MINAHEVTCEYFHLPNDSDFWKIIGIENPSNADSKAIKRAVRRRFAQLLASPNASSDQIVIVKKYLATISVELLQQAPASLTTVDSSSQELTSLDQSIIAALIAGGGWNSNTRSRLVEIAASHSLTVGGLMRILEALGEAAREGNGPLAPQRRGGIHPNRTWTAVPSKKSTLSQAENYLSELSDKITPDLSNPTPVVTLRLAIVFASLTLLAFILALVILFSDDSKKSEVTSTIPFVEIVQEYDVPAQHPLYQSYPTFKERSIEYELVKSADKVLLLPALFERLQNELLQSNSSGKQLTSSWLQSWREAILVLSEGWAFTDPFLLETLTRQIMNIVESSSVTQSRMLSAFAIPPFQVSHPTSITMRIWHARILSQLSCNPDFPSEIRSLLRSMQMQNVDACDGDEANLQACYEVAVELVDRTEFGGAYAKVWEAWILSVQASQSKDSASSLYLRAITSFFDASLDVTRESLSRSVIGRLVTEIEWANDLSIRDAILKMYLSPSVRVQNLFLLGKLLESSSKASWISNESIVQLDDSLDTRALRHATLLARWPYEVQSRTMEWNVRLPAGFDEEIASYWNQSYNSLQTLPTDNPETLASIRTLNESAVSIWIGRPDLARELVDTSTLLDEVSAPFVTLHAPPIDGKWSSSFGRTGANNDARLDKLAELEGSSYTDLGVEDARTLARASISNIYSRIRVYATELIITNFPHSKTVAIALLDELPHAKSKEQVVSLVANLTDAILPDQADSQWSKEARKALVQYALTAGDETLTSLDEVAAKITSSLLTEYLLLQPSSLPPSSEVTPAIAFEMLLDAWGGLPDSSDVYASSGLLQAYVMLQRAYLRILQKEELRWRGRDVAVQVPIERYVSQADSILSQMIELEKQIAQHWHSLFVEMALEFKNRSANQ